jgi:hypothetical protein
MSRHETTQTVPEMTDAETDAWVAGRLAMLGSFARGCGYEAIQARAKIERLSEMSDGEIRSAARAALALGL